jgi:hypothetical protein
MAMVYRWRGGTASGANAQAIGEALEAVRTENGGALAPRDVVVAARPDESPLHRYFEWRDSVAAVKYREEQARSLIRSIRVIPDENQDTDIPAFVCVAKGEDGPYQATQVALADPTSRAYVLNQARKELAGWRKRYQDLTEFAGLVAVIDEHLAVTQAA